MGKLIDASGMVCANEEVGPDLFIMELRCPEIAHTIRPGQFVHIKIPGMDDHILRRPFSVYATLPERGSFQILYQVVGYGSSRMTELTSKDTMAVIGPVGSSWTIPNGAQRALLVGGGVGAAPLFMLAETLVKRSVEVDIVLGAQTKNALVCHERYARLLQEHALTSSNLRCSTDDGSFGHAGFCTSLIEEALGAQTYDYAAICGPEPMMKSAVSLIKERSIMCEVSLERRMACGIGACLSCVVETTEGMKRACVDGPIFDAGVVVFS